MLGVSFSIYEKTMHFKGRHAEKKYDVQIKRLWVTDTCSLSERIHISNIYVKWSFAKNIYLKGYCQFMLEWCPFFILWRKKKSMRNGQSILLSRLFQGSIQLRGKLLTPGVMRKGMRWIPPCVTKEGLKSNKAHIETRRT